MKKIAFVLAVLLLGVLLPVSAGAQTWSGPDFTLEIPDGFYQFSGTETEGKTIQKLPHLGSIPFAATKPRHYG